MEANAVGPKRILKSTDEAKSPHRILVRSLLKSRNKLREKYRELRAECKRWRNQAAAVERSRSTWRERGWHTKQVPKRIEPRGPSSSPNCNNSGSNRSDGKWNQPTWRDWPPWKGRKKRTRMNLTRSPKARRVADRGCIRHRRVKTRCGQVPRSPTIPAQGKSYQVRKIRALLFHGLCRLGKIDWASETHQELDRCLSRTITASNNFND